MENAPNNVESRFILWKALDQLEKIFCILPVAVMTVIVFVAVLCRYVLKAPLGWSEEVTLICMITYTTPENIKCRDNKLFDDTLLRENMEHYFTMGGCRYLENRRVYDPQMSVEDAVQGLSSIFQALSDGDETRFHTVPRVQTCGVFYNPV